MEVFEGLEGLPRIGRVGNPPLLPPPHPETPSRHTPDLTKSGGLTYRDVFFYGLDISFELVQMKSNQNDFCDVTLA